MHRGSCLCGAVRFEVNGDIPPPDAWFGIALGAFDGPTETKIKFHIFVADKGDYYEIGDGLPQHQH